MNEPTNMKRILVFYVGVPLVGLLLIAVCGFITLGYVTNHQPVPPELLAAPKSILPETGGLDGQAPQTSARPAVIQQGDRVELHKDLNYENYLKDLLARDGSATGARLYLDLIKGFERDGVYRSLNKILVNKGRNVIPLAPLTATQAAWLHDQADLVELMLRFAECGSLPAPSREEYLAQAHQSREIRLPMINYDTVSRVCNLLTLEVQRRMQAQDPAGALRAGLAGLRLAQTLRRDPCLGTYAISMADLMIKTMRRYMIENSRLPTQELLTLADTLTSVHHDLYSPVSDLAELEIEYLQRRSFTVAMLRSPWQDFYHFEVNRGPFTFAVSLGGKNKIDLPRLDRHALAALHGMRDKHKLPQQLREFDECWREIVARSRMDYPTLAAQKPLAMPASYYVLYNDGSQKMDWNVETRNYTYNAETEFNLTRAAIDWQLNHPAPAALAAINIKANPDHPWRDPFTEKPFRLDQAATTTTISSQGPDPASPGPVDELVIRLLH